MAKKETSYARPIGIFILIFLKLIEEAFRSRYISQGKRNGEEGEEVQNKRRRNMPGLQYGKERNTNILYQ